ncbi:hypothetical protein [Bifidobacterium aquikefiricola]|uniref:Uncharacterized protein n=1 Tax=Bifidobacterium aquikefiricola TaxID=3059038 RepID=A0AB39U632_9BIFI
MSVPKPLLDSLAQQTLNQQQLQVVSRVSALTTSQPRPDSSEIGDSN